MTSSLFTCIANPKAMAYTSPAGMRKHETASLMFGRTGKRSFGQKAWTTCGVENRVKGQKSRDKSAGMETHSKGKNELGNWLYRSMICKSRHVNSSGGCDWCLWFPPEELSGSTQTRLDFVFQVLVLGASLTPDDLGRDDTCNTIMPETQRKIKQTTAFHNYTQYIL